MFFTLSAQYLNNTQTARYTLHRKYRFQFQCISGQITINPKHELRVFWREFPYLTTIWGDQPAGKVAIICPDVY